eukprot:s391_g14.t1
MIVVVMAQVLKELVATQKFLNGVRNLPHFEELQRKQVARLKPIVEKNVISVEMAGRILEALSPDVWSGTILDDLKASIADKSQAPEDSSSRAGLQDFTALPGYLTQDWWSKLESRAAGEYKLELLTNFAGSLGLKNPTEASYGALVALSFYADKTEFWPESDQVGLLRKHKDRMRRWLQKVPDPSVRLDVLPEKPEDLPASVFQAVFPTGLIPGAPTLMDLGRLRRVIVDFRLRGPKDGLVSSSVPSASSGQMDAAALALAAATLVARTQVPREEVDLPGFRMLNATKEEKKIPAPPLALEDIKAPQVSMEPPVARQQTSRAEEPAEETPGEAIAALRASLKKTDEGSQGKPSVTKVMKKPANQKAKQKKSMARPAAAVKKSLKRPAAAGSKSGQERAAESDTRNTPREKLFKKIPKYVLERYKTGCSRCYHRAYCTVIRSWDLRGLGESPARWMRLASPFSPSKNKMASKTDEEESAEEDSEEERSRDEEDVKNEERRANLVPRKQESPRRSRHRDEDAAEERKSRERSRGRREDKKSRDRSRGRRGEDDRRSRARSRTRRGGSHDEERRDRRGKERPPEPPGKPPKKEEGRETQEGHKGRGSKGQGKPGSKSIQKRTTCEICKQKISMHPAAIEQHQWLNEYCLTMQAYNRMTATQKQKKDSATKAQDVAKKVKASRDAPSTVARSASAAPSALPSVGVEPKEKMDRASPDASRRRRRKAEPRKKRCKSSSSGSTSKARKKSQRHNVVINFR